VVREVGMVDPALLATKKDLEAKVDEEVTELEAKGMIGLEEVVEVEESDNESDKSNSHAEAAEEELEDTEFMMANMRLAVTSTAQVQGEVLDIESEEEVEDVVVEATEVVEATDVVGSTARRCQEMAKAVEETGEVESKSGASVEGGKSKVRRGKRRREVVKSADTSMLKVSTDSCTSTRSSRRRPATKPLVEYSVLAVLKHQGHLEHHMVQRTGRVVAIREHKHSRKAAGTIKLMTDPNSRFFYFSPTDSKVPRMKIPLQEAPGGFTARPQDCEGVMFVARIVRWEQVNAALGTLEGSLGRNSDIKVRTEGLLIENNIDYSEFGEEVLRDLPAEHESWQIPEQEARRRRDFRQECVFTIDPLTARDLDDALSVTLEPNGHYRVGVHIADVSYFVREDTALDRVAGDRATSTYLVDQVIPMLPRPLCENLCSLNPGVDRLCFSVEWTINQQAQVMSEWFGRTVIRSCAKLAYEHAQSMLERPGREFGEGELPPVTGGYTAKDLSTKVNMLQLLAVKLRRKREEAGALRLDQPKLCFTLNKETGLPDGYRLHQHRDSNRLIEEFMLLANMAVAHKIYKAFPELGVLRRHPAPKAAMMEDVVEQLRTEGVDLDSSSSAGLARSIDRMRATFATSCNPEETMSRMAAIVNLLSKPMELARYFCTGMFDLADFHHFALNVPLYTHFTSPIRRYPDILVHRLLDASITGREPPWRPDQVQLQTEHCNDTRLAAKRVGEASAELFLGLFVGECGPVVQPATVIQVMDHSMDVLILEMGVIKRVYVDRLGCSKQRFRRVAGVSALDLTWGEGREAVARTFTFLSRVTVILEKADKAFEFTAVLEAPTAPEEITL